MACPIEMCSMFVEFHCDKIKHDIYCAFNKENETISEFPHSEIKIRKNSSFFATMTRADGFLHRFEIICLE